MVSFFRGGEIFFTAPSVPADAGATRLQHSNIYTPKYVDNPNSIELT